MKYSVHKIFIILLAGCAITFFAYQVIDWWCVVAGPIITLFACRPVRQDSEWLWEQHTSNRPPE